MKGQRYQPLPLFLRSMVIHKKGNSMKNLLRITLLAPFVFFGGAQAMGAYQQAPQQPQMAGQMAYRQPLAPQQVPPAGAFAAQQSPFKIKFTGSVRYDAFWDTRQIVGFRQDVSFLLPNPSLFDSCNRDIYGAPQFHMLAIRTNFGWEIDGPPILKTKATRVVIRADFTGPWGLDNVLDNRPAFSMSVINGLMLTEGYFQLDWECRSLLIGQFWHPLFDPRFSEGYLMIEPIARSPQIRFTQKFGCFEFLATAAGQIDYCSDGPSIVEETYTEPRFLQHTQRFNPDLVIPDRTSSFIRNSLIPNFNFQIRSVWDRHIAGIAFDVKVLKPRLFTITPDVTNVKEYHTAAVNLTLTGPATPSLVLDGTNGTDGNPLLPSRDGSNVFVNLETVRPNLTKAYEKFAAYSVMAFAGFDWDCFTLKLKGFYGQAMGDFYMLGGYGVVEKDGLLITPVATTKNFTGKEEYSPVCSAAFMGSLAYKYSKHLVVTIGGGYAKNLGLRGCKKLVVTHEPLNPPAPTFFTRQANNLQYDVFHFKADMDYIGKFNANAKFIYLPVVFIAGVEYNRAGYGTITDEAKIIDNENVNHVRAFFAAIYNF